MNDAPFAATKSVSAARATAMTRLIRGRSLAECAEGRRDNILVLRLLAAFLVVLGHSGVGGGGTWPFDPVAMLFPPMPSHLVGLVMFFMISGFLITLSFERRPKIVRFLRARALRLWPALIVCVLAWAFVIGPLLSDVGLAEYFNPARPDNPYRHAWAAISLYGPLSLNLPGLFEHNPVTRAVNGQLWTIHYEAGLYLCVATAGIIGLLRFRWVASAAIAAFFVVLIIWPMMAGQFDPNRSLPRVVQGFFGAGAIVCLLRRYIPVSTGMMITLAALCIAARHSIHFLPVIWLTVGYFTLWFAYVPRLPDVPCGADLSYGIYLWAWPVQQSIVLGGAVHEPIVVFLITVPIVVAIGAMSWFLVEKPALRLKDVRAWRGRDNAVPLKAPN